MKNESPIRSSFEKGHAEPSSNPPPNPKAGPQPVSDYWLKKVLIGGSTVLTISSAISAAGAIILLVGGNLNATRGATCSSRLQWQQRQNQIEAEIESQAAQAEEDRTLVECPPNQDVEGQRKETSSK